MSTSNLDPLERQTDEGAQELRPQHELVITGGPWPELEGESQTMIINMGPQHPSTHGVLRLMMELDGETVVRAKPIVGYLHTGMEKTGEELTYVQGATNVTRMDYASPLSNELVYSHRGRAAARRRGARARDLGSHDARRSSGASAPTCSSRPPTAWTSARSRCCSTAGASAKSCCACSR